MKSKKLLLAGLITAALVTGGIIYAADHIDAPAVTGQTSDITDMYVFAGSNPANLVFVANTQGLLSPSATATTKFDANTLIQFNIDTNGDNVEDLVLQAIYDGNGKVNVYGPIAPSMTGLKSKLEGNITASVAVTPYGAGTPNIGTGSTGIKVFAGPRDDPFFFDLTAYHGVIDGTKTGFDNPGTDAFAGTNVMGLVIEVPKTLIEATPSGTINVWCTTKKKI
jgi:hypothetical protein